jgi:hypothetical protein
MKNEKDADGEAAGRESPEPPTGQTPFQRFEEFARKVISVPKAEIDEREREYRRKREGRPKHRPA